MFRIPHRAPRRAANSRAAALAIVSALTLSACASLGLGGKDKLPQSDAMAMLSDARGADRGRVDVFRDASGLRLEIIARGFPAGTYGMHVHAVGRCDAPGFTSAGPHLNPTGVQHGRDNPAGAHHGDLPNLVVEPGTIGRATVMMVGTPFEGSTGLFDADGAALVIHARPDDMKTDPSGNSGDRIVCGVLTRPAAR